MPDIQRSAVSITRTTNSFFLQLFFRNLPPTSLKPRTPIRRLQWGLWSRLGGGKTSWRTFLLMRSKPVSTRGVLDRSLRLNMSFSFEAGILDLSSNRQRASVSGITDRGQKLPRICHPHTAGPPRIALCRNRHVASRRVELPLRFNKHINIRKVPLVVAIVIGRSRSCSALGPGG